ncbi:ATP-dependent DNA helicase [Prescottella sp. R16]|uniref:ATP-dependent helicase n=1 Tax=Prescottella sp. R16 TaxID=3064529 RepID=UPI00272EA4B7|nr:ATP-dependent DNA helicase [Prescottella sp. R16]
MTETGASSRTTVPSARLVGRVAAPAVSRTWPAGPARVLAGAPPGRDWHPWQILGGPGTGKTSLLVDAAVARILAGTDPESVLVLTQSRRASTAIRAQITEGLLAAADPASDERPWATREPLVRTVHSYAFAVLRLQAATHGNPPPRLITGAEQDTVLRELLRGDIEDGAEYWPPRLRPALGTTGFAVELRNLMLRAAERGLGPEDLIDLGERHNRPEWVAAGRFATTYEQGMLLRGSVGVEAPEATAPALDAAELISAALTALATDSGLLQRERHRIRHLLVDDAQHLDPQAAQLVRLIGTGTDTTAVAGDPDQSIFAFRGADPRFLTDLAEKDSPAQVLLDTGYRSAPDVAAVAAKIASLLPGRPPHRGLAAPVTDDGAPGRVAVRVVTTPAKEAALIADTLRRAHLIDGVPWSQMAIVARSVPRVLPPLRRALLAAGVPVTTAASELPLARRHGVAGLLAVLQALSGGEFTGEDALALLSGPVGGAEPVSLRRLRRGLRRVELASGGDRDSAELLRAIIVDGPDADGLAHLLPGLTDVESLSLRRVLKVLRRARIPLDRGRGIEEVLWAAWQATGLEKRWAAASAFGGPIGAQADRDLDAVVALFDQAADYVDRLPRAQLAGFVDYLVSQEIPGSPRARTVAPQDTVTILSAHSAAGRQWQVVAVAGVQEGLWPSLGARGTLLGVEALIDLTSGAAEPDPASPTAYLSRTAPLLAEERRLFHVACSRARSSLLITAVDAAGSDEELMPSRFVDELLGTDNGADDDTEDTALQPDPRVLAMPTLVAELRSVVCDPGIAATDPDRQRRAAHQLARLADAGVRGAHPDSWYGLADPSSSEPLWETADGPVPMSPSTIELITNCPLRWMLERHGGSDGDNTHAIAGTLVHTLVQALAGNIPPDRVNHALETAWDAVDLGSDWYARRELERTRGMLDAFANWLRRSRSELTEIGVEVTVDGLLEPRDENDPPVRIKGRIDRLERDAEGRPVIIDVKTARNAVTKDQAQQHAQLAAYQVAAAHGLVDGQPATEPGGARLVFVARPHNKDGATQREQLALDDEGLDLWETTIHAAAAATQGPTFAARINDSCRHCPVLSSCPAHDEGRQVTSR